MSKIIVVGDSIVYGKWDSEGGWVARVRKYIDETHNIDKGGNFQVYNLGIPGDVAPRLAQRFENELFMRIPSADTDKRNLVLLAIGINDSCPNNWMTLKQTEELEFKESMRMMIDSAVRLACKVAVVGLTPVNPGKSTGLQFSDKEVTRYDRYLSEVCEEKHIPKLHLFEELQTANFAELLVDAVHPNNEGHNLLTNKILEFLDKQKFIEYLVSSEFAA